MRLDTAEAPLQSIAFLKLAEQGFYDGTTVYRVDPGDRLEAGDPDGDGRGGPGFTLRDEPGPRRLRPGAFGLVRPAPTRRGAGSSSSSAPAPTSRGRSRSWARW